MSRARILAVDRHLALAYGGRLEVLTVHSELLEDNPLGDPADREVFVLHPPPDATDPPPPLLLALPAFTSRPHAFVETHPWRLGAFALHDRRSTGGAAPPAVLVAPDAFTRLGGSQYLDSPSTGPWEGHLLREVLPLVEEHLGREGPWGVAGKSSGGFGALRLSMRHPERFRACASISGDCGFDMLFPGEFLACLRGLQPYGGDPARFLAAFAEEPDLSGDGHAVLNVLAMAACYSPNPASELGFDLPFDLETGELVQTVWQRWLEFDPLNAVDRHVEALRGLKALHVECGTHDEFHLQWGARRLSRRLSSLGVAHTHEEHPGSHRGLDGRLAAGFERLARALAGEP